MKRFGLFSLVVMAQWAITPLAFADLKLPAMFTDGAVLQQGAEAPVWGWSDANAEVTVEFGGQKKTATADAKGHWQVELDKMEVEKRGRELTVKSGDASVVVKDVLVGEVWFCSGQSNMEWTVNRAIKPDFIKPDELPLIRHIKVPHVRAKEPADDFQGSWAKCDSKNVGNFTAVGFYFAYQLYQELGVPIGLIGCNWGGTRIEPWTPPAGFETVADDLDASKLKDTSTMYNGMVSAVQPYAIRGAIWYQGESNGSEGMTYFHKMRAMINGWRKTWDQGEFPFYFVQLANFRQPNADPKGGDGYANLRDAQLTALKEIPSTGMACIIDIGEAKDIHPRNKFDVGKRLSLWALKNEYEKANLVHSGPIYKDMKVQGGEVHISFDSVGGGLMVAKKSNPQSIDAPQPVNELTGFAIAGEDGNWVWADAKISGETVIVSSPKVEKPTAVRYAYSMNPDKASLYNKEGLPASPFRTDGPGY